MALLMQNDGDKEPVGNRLLVIGRLRRRAPESPATDARADERREDNFGIPLDALDETPPTGIEA